MFRKNQSIKPFCIAATAIAFSTLMPSTVRAQSVDSASKEPLLHSTGSGLVQRVPTRVDISLGVEAIETTALAAQASAEKTMKATVAAIRALKLADGELQTGSVELSPRYERRTGYEETPAKIIGYTGSITLSVRTSNLESPAQVIDAALQAGCNRVNHVSFTLKELLEAREEAIKLATKAAKRKAEVMAEALGLKLERVSHATTTSNEGGWSNRIGNWAQLNAANTRADGGVADGGEVVVPGKIDVTAEVSVSFVAAPK